MNRQDVFNTVVKHLRAQGVQAMDESGCMYRTPDGKKCAAGALIPDELYRPDMERKNIRAICHGYPAVAKHFDLDFAGDDIDFLMRLQSIHDQNPPELWADDLTIFAARHGLEMPA